MIDSSHVLRLREYETAAVGSIWDAERKVIPHAVVAQLERLHHVYGDGLLDISRRTVRARNFVGTIGLGDRAIEILPKVDGADAAVRRRLVEMLAISGVLPHLESGIADLAPSCPTLLDAFMQAYLRQLTLQWRRGRVADYRREERNRLALRGKMVFPEQLRRNRLRPERFYTRADEFVVDVPVTRLLKAAVEVCRRRAVADVTRRSAGALLPEFDGVADQHWPEAELEAVQADRRSERFAPLVVLAKMLLRGRMPDRPGLAGTFSLLFDMNRIFEQYVGQLLRRVCPPPLRVQLQAGGRSLLLRGGKKVFLLRPDVAVRLGSQFVGLIDTKWKLLSHDRPYDGVRQSDMYQVYAYAREFDCRCVLLLYPAHAGVARSKIADYDLPPADAGGPRIEVRTIDVSGSPRDVAEQLRVLLAEVCRRRAPENQSPVTTRGRSG